MNNRLLAFAALVVFATAASGMQERSWKHQASPAAAAVALVPETLGERRITRRWSNLLRGGIVEDGAMYAGASGVPVQLDFFRNRPTAHNGIGCYLLEGESLAWERSRVLQMAHAPAQFDVALLSSNDGLRLIAATECGAGGCTERGLWGEPVADSQLRWNSISMPHAEVVPVSIMLSSPLDGADPAVVEERLMSQLEDAARLIDLAPAQKLASLQ